MLSKFKKSKYLIWIFLFSLLLFSRFIKLDWGNGYFFNPDENNMGNAIAQMSFSNLNPHFFAYGQFPLYLAFFSSQLLDYIKTGQFADHINFQIAILSLRVWSAIFSIASIYFLYRISQFIFKAAKNRHIFLLLSILNPGLIQFSHFGTTESILIFVFIVNIFLSLNIYKNLKLKYIFWASLISGIGLASKVSALILTGPILLSLLFVLFKDRKILTTISYSIVFILLTSLICIVASPYNLIANSDFLSSMHYEVSVANGTAKVFYTNQFLDSIPYLFQLIHIFPYTSGIFVYSMSFIGIAFIFLRKKIKNPYWLLILIPSLVYFIYTGQLYTKWTRFMSPLFFIFPLLATFFIIQFKNNLLKYLLIFISILPGVFFLSLYLKPDIRFSSSEWVYKNIPLNSVALSESGNVINFPLNLNTINVANVEFYQLDTNPEVQFLLPKILYKSNYIFIPSRRIYKNQNNSHFPISQNYYKNLFSGKLGFSQIKSFYPNVDLLLNSEDAEETWSVFDHPSIKIYQKTKDLKLNDYEDLIYDNHHT